MLVDLKSRTYQFSLDVIRFLAKLNKKDWAIEVISKQLLRSATSIGANVIEAKAGSSRKDFTNFYRHALKSSNETLYWIQLLGDTQKDTEGELVRLAKEAEELTRILTASVIKLKQ